MQATRGTPLTGAAAPPRDRRPLLAVWLTAFVVLLADVISKVEVVAHLDPGRRVPVLGHWLQLDLTRNAGAAFSLGAGATVLFTAVAAAVVLVIARTARRLVSRSWGICLGLLLGGALGNLTDRLFRAPGPLRGQVVDWLELPHWPVFNLADSAITAGAVLAVLLGLLGVALAGDTDPVDPADPADPADPPVSGSS